MHTALSATSLLALALAAPAMAQPAAAPPAATPPPASAAASPANPADVGTMDGILAALYDVISGPAGRKRDWGRMKSLFLDGARMIPTGTRDGETRARVTDVNGYIERSSPFFEKEGFYERESARRVDRFGAIAQVFSTYESRHDPGAEPFARGINSIQLFFDGKRWWIVSVFWQAETDTLKLPAEYLHSKG
jgi:hypothetical protein